MKSIYGPVFYCLTTFACTSCSDENNRISPCELTIDTVSIIDQRKVADVTYYLVLRISGWHDKTESLELYDAKPGFDQCAKSNVEPIDGDSLDLEKPVSHIYLDSKNKLLYIEYSMNKQVNSNNNNLKIELKE